MKSTVTHPPAVMRPKRVFPIISLLAGVAVLILMIPGDALAQLPVDLGDAARFGVLGATTVTNAGNTTIEGDLGLSPGTSVTGFPPGVVNGTIFIDPAQEAVDGQASLTTAYNDAAGRAPDQEFAGAADLSNMILDPGVYKSTGSFEITSAVLTLDAGGDANAVWIFQMATTLTVGSGMEVVLSGGAQAANVFWQVGSSATIGTNAVFNGTIMALTSIALNAGATMGGRALADNGAVTLDDNTVTIPANGAPLPVELSLFSATVDGLDVVLHWETLSERNSSGFEVQYLPSGIGLKTLAFVAGAGNSTDRLSYEYRVTELGSGTHRFRLKQIDFNGDFEYSPVVEVTVAEERYVLRAAYPNPFNLTTTLEYALSRESDVRLSVFDVLGREVRVLAAGPRPAGSHGVVLDASDLPAGPYFYRLRAGGFEDMKALVVLK